MSSAIGVAGKFLFNIGQGIANAVRRRRSEKANAKKMQAVMGLIEGERKKWTEYMKGINTIYDQLGDKTKREIQSVFRTQTKQLKNAIQQRRIPEYLAGVEKLSKAQSQAISDAMLGVESARLQAEGGALQTSFAQASQLAGLVPALQSIYQPQGKGSLGSSLQTAFKPFTDWVEKSGNTTITKWLEGGAGMAKDENPADQFTSALSQGAQKGVDEVIGGK